jgi:hypothetical protein
MITPTLIPTYHPHGYNLSLIRFNDQLISSYRYHPNHKEWRTKISIQAKKDGFVQERTLQIFGIYADMSHEDGRLFIYDGKLYISVTVSAFPGSPNVTVPCATGYGELKQDGNNWVIEKFHLPKFGRNNFEAQEKNHVYFEHNKKLHYIYQCSPEQVVVVLNSDGESVYGVHTTKSPTWAHGDIRGGTQPLPYKGKWLRFFHSLHKQGKDRLVSGPSSLATSGMCRDGSIGSRGSRYHMAPFLKATDGW